MAKRKASTFTIKLGSSLKLSGKAKAEVAGAVGGAAAAALAHHDAGSAVAFVPRIDWPGGYLIDLKQHLTDKQLGEILGG